MGRRTATNLVRRQRLVAAAELAVRIRQLCRDGGQLLRCLDIGHILLQQRLAACKGVGFRDQWPLCRILAAAYAVLQATDVTAAVCRILAVHVVVPAFNSELLMWTAPM